MSPVQVCISESAGFCWGVQRALRPAGEAHGAPLETMAELASHRVTVVPATCTFDLIVVIGGRNSGNTSRLAELRSAVQPRTHHIEQADEILPEWFSGVRTVGVTAGASTPPEQIEAVVGRLEEIVP